MCLAPCFFLTIISILIAIGLSVKKLLYFCGIRQADWLWTAAVVAAALRYRSPAALMSALTSIRRLSPARSQRPVGAPTHHTRFCIQTTRLIHSHTLSHVAKENLLSILHYRAINSFCSTFNSFIILAIILSLAAASVFMSWRSC